MSGDKTYEYYERLVGSLLQAINNIPAPIPSPQAPNIETINNPHQNVQSAAQEVASATSSLVKSVGGGVVFEVPQEDEEFQ